MEREERTLGRLVRGLVSLSGLVDEKVVLVAAVAVGVAGALVRGFGLIVEVTGVQGGQPWARVPLLLAGLVVAAACGALVRAATPRLLS